MKLLGVMLGARSIMQSIFRSAAGRQEANAERKRDRSLAGDLKMLCIKRSRLRLRRTRALWEFNAGKEGVEVCRECATERSA
jgi:hypothetical protein